jgi:hypothetical protein
MSRRSWKRLAGCIVIDCLAAAAQDYRAGAAAVDHVRAVAIEDRRGFRAIFAETDFPITRAVSDFVAAQLVRAYELDRAGIVIAGTGDAAEEPAAILGAIERAIGGLSPANLSFSNAISVRTSGGACLAIFYPIRLSGCRDGARLTGPIRAAFQMIDLPHPLQGRDQAAPSYPVQAIAIGRTTILALGGAVAAGRHDSAGRMVVQHANDTTDGPPGPPVDEAVANVLKRVR